MFLTHFGAPASQLANQPASRPAIMCSSVGWATNVSESLRFRIKINTILAEDHFGFFPEPGMLGTVPKMVAPLGSQTNCFNTKVKDVIIQYDENSLPHDKKSGFSCKNKHNDQPMWLDPAQPTSLHAEMLEFVKIIRVGACWVTDVMRDKIIDSG